MTTVALDYIEVDERGVAKLIGHRIKVMHLVMAQRVENYSTEELMEAYPDLTPSEIHAALAYYHANRERVDEQIEASVRFAEEMRAKFPNKVTRAEYEARWRQLYPGRPLPSETDPQ